jgi:hypothetical protein
MVSSYGRLTVLQMMPRRQWCKFVMRNINDVLTEVGKQTFLKVFKSQIHKFSVSFCYRQSANFLGMRVRKSQISTNKNTAQLCHKTAQNVVFLLDFYTGTM